MSKKTARINFTAPDLTYRRFRAAVALEGKSLTTVFTEFMDQHACLWGIDPEPKPQEDDI